MGPKKAAGPLNKLEGLDFECPFRKGSGDGVAVCNGDKTSALVGSIGIRVLLDGTRELAPYTPCQGDCI